MKSAGWFPAARDGLVARSLGLLVLLVCGPLFTAHAADIHWANPISGNWVVATNWTPRATPTLTNDVFITTEGTYGVSFNTGQAANLHLGAASGTQTLTNNGALSCPGDFLIGTNGRYVMRGGMLNLYNLEVAGAWRWESGSMQSTGSTRILPGGSLEIVERTSHSQRYRVLENQGFMAWREGQLGSPDGLITNAPGAVWEVGPAFDNQNGSRGSLVNAGLLRKIGTNTSLLQGEFVNLGAVDLLDGALHVIDFTQNAGEIALRGGHFYSSFRAVQLNGGRLIGSGGVTGTVANAALVAPGLAPPDSPIGQLRISGNYTQALSGELHIDLAGLVPGSGFDQLVVSRGTIPSNGRAALDGLLQVSLTDGFYPPARAQFPVLVCTNRTGTFSSFVYPSNEVGLAVSYSALGVTLDVINVRPVISPVVDPVIAEASPFALQLEATDDDLPAQSLTWSLVEGPAGLSISGTGLVTWTPREEDGPGFFDVTVRVTDDGTPPLSVIRTFRVEVQEVNEAPVLTLPLPLAINEGSTLSVMATSRDIDVPENGATFALVSAPPGMTIDPASGAISWTTTEADGPGEYSVVVRVTDFNSVAVNDQALGQTGSFTITVREVNAPPHLVVPPEITIEAGGMVSWLVTATDEDLPANALAFEHLAGPGTVRTDGRLRWTPNNAHIGTTNSVEIRVTDNASPSLSGTGIVRIVVVSPPILARPERVGNGWRLAWSAVPARQYQLQAAADPAGGWIEIKAPVTATGTNASIELPEVLPPPARAAHGFFRVRVLP